MTDDDDIHRYIFISFDRYNIDIFLQIRHGVSVAAFDEETDKLVGVAINKIKVGWE